ncbi:MAG: pyridoxine 5'-phosphate synthase [Rickettsiales bacterium]
MKLGINIDHVATIRNARGELHPCPIRAALLAMEAGADSITAHLREDRRHIVDHDIERLKNEIPLPLNLEMAATEEMLDIALKIKPHAICLVPEKRQELTTEGGLNVTAMRTALIPYIKKLTDNGSRVSLFVDPDINQIEAAKDSGAEVVEIHTGTYAKSYNNKATQPETHTANLANIEKSATYAKKIGLAVHAGHGLNYENVAKIAKIPEITELNIGHFLIGEAIFIGLKEAIIKMRNIINIASNE